MTDAAAPGPSRWGRTACTTCSAAGKQAEQGLGLGRPHGWAPNHPCSPPTRPEKRTTQTAPPPPPTHPLQYNGSSAANMASMTLALEINEGNPIALA